MSRPTAVAAAAPEPEPRLVAPASPPLSLAALMPTRSAQDVLAGVHRLHLGGRRYVLQVLSIAANRRWMSRLEARIAGALDALAPGADLDTILRTLAASTPQLLDALYDYDEARTEAGEPTRPGALPPRDALEEDATPAQVLTAVLELWAAANPTDTAEPPATPAAGTTAAAPRSATSQPTSTRRRSTAGVRGKSKSA